MKLKHKLLVPLLSLLLLLPAVASARGLVPCGGPGEPICTVDHIFVMAGKLFGAALAFAGMFAVAMIVYRGFGLVLSAGNEEQITKHKGGLTNAIIGFVLVMLTFTIVNTLLRGVFKLRINLANPQCYINDECN